jgi:hypothetical protein
LAEKPTFFLIMPVTVLDMVDRFKGIDIDVLVEESFLETEDEFKRLNTEQLFEGKLNDGSDIKPEYAESTKRRKKRKGQPSDRVTTRDTGDYHNEFTVRPDNDELQIGSNVEYEQYLDKRYGKKLYGLMPVRNEQFTFGPFWSVLQTKLEEKTHLTFE